MLTTLTSIFSWSTHRCLYFIIFSILPLVLKLLKQQLGVQISSYRNNHRGVKYSIGYIINDIMTM